jgi:UDPglucose--hexose-1-phosphate uridylyltransferase
MAELRKDYLLDRYVIIATERAKRPDQFQNEQSLQSAQLDYFAPGNEHLTPYEMGHIGSPWRIRWFENKFNAVDMHPDSNLPLIPKTDNTFYTFAKAYGDHEVIVETNDSRQLWDLSDKEILDILKVYLIRIRDLSKSDKIKYVQVFKNHGSKAGCSIQHSHSQIISLNIIPQDVLAEEKAVEEYYEKNSRNAYDDLLKFERHSFREIFSDNYVFAFCPYASRYPLEVKILPFRNAIRMEDLTEQELVSFSHSIKKVIDKLKKVSMSFNMFIRYGIKHQRFYIDILPRPNIWAGFELATGIIINPVPPEDAAKFYKEK